MFSLEDEKEDSTNSTPSALTRLPGEKVPVRPQKSRSWKEYLEDFLIKSGHVSAAAVLDLSGNCLTSTEQFPQLYRYFSISS